MRELPGSRLFQEVVTNEYKDLEVGECLKELVKRPIKCHGQGGKWQETRVKRYPEPNKVGSNPLQ